MVDAGGREQYRRKDRTAHVTMLVWSTRASNLWAVVRFPFLPMAPPWVCGPERALRRLASLVSAGFNRMQGVRREGPPSTVADPGADAPCRIAWPRISPAVPLRSDLWGRGHRRDDVHILGSSC